jgi:D-tyrosyl-tRNA(Tyr) deacylase
MFTDFPMGIRSRTSPVRVDPASGVKLGFGAMKALLQRVTLARVSVAGREIAAIDAGVVVFLAFERGDGVHRVLRLVDRVIAYRLFPDARGRFSLDVRTVAGQILWVPEFTLAADTRQGRRADLFPALEPDASALLFRSVLEHARECGGERLAQAGRFGAHMAVSLVNDGPVTFLLSG